MFIISLICGASSLVDRNVIYIQPNYFGPWPLVYDIRFSIFFRSDVISYIDIIKY